MATNHTTADAVAITTTTADAMVLKLEAALATGAGVVNVNFGGVSTSYNRDQAIKELNFWMRRQAVENGTRPRAARINLN